MVVNKFNEGSQLMMIQTLIQRRCVLKSYDELKVEMETIQQQMAEANKSERSNALKELKLLCKEFGFTAGMLKGSLVEGLGRK
tara:strand:+ start:512 stop:760 length:249 start_codon:yes stop_codon:yes gene_type:complete